VERSVGRLESKASPMVAAEVAGQVRRVEVEVGHAVAPGALLALIEPEDYRLRVASARAEIGRLEAQVEQQERLVTRYQQLATRDFFAQNSLEEAQAQLKVLRRQLDAARNAIEEAQRDLARTEVRAPVAGRIESRLVDPGDYVQEGTGMFRLSTDDVLRAVLPFPERLVDRLAIGQATRLSSPTDPQRGRLEAAVTELRPTVGGANRAVEALVDFRNPGGWRAGASVNGEVVIETRQGTVTVPEGAVVLRPAGATVYVVEGDKVRAQVVRTGHQDAGRVEIREGLQGDETLALDGAGFLTDGAPVRFQEQQS
jgi:RND family efflux transporter MFP subunit